MAMLGLQKVLTAVPELFIGLKVAGGLYLLWLGYKNFSRVGAADGLFRQRDGRQPLFAEDLPRRAVYSAQQSQNCAGVRLNFTALLPAQIPTAFYYIVPLMSFLIDVSWYSLVALVLSADRPRRVYLRLKRRIDIATATVLGALGLRLIATSLTR